MTVEPTREQRRWQKQYEEEHARMFLAVNNCLRLWSACDDKRCRRAHACRGESALCFLRHWRQVPEEKRMSFRVALRAQKSGNDRQKETEAV
jgi:hypothetical protein